MNGEVKINIKVSTNISVQIFSAFMLFILPMLSPVQQVLSYNALVYNYNVQSFVFRQ